MSHISILVNVLLMCAKMASLTHTAVKHEQNVVKLPSEKVVCPNDAISWHFPAWMQQLHLPSRRANKLSSLLFIDSMSTYVLTGVRLLLRK